MLILKRILTYIYTSIGIRSIKQYKSKPRINFYSRFNGNTYIGNNCHFNGMIVRGQGELIIGDNFHCGKQCLVINSYHKYEGANAIPYDTSEMLHKPIIIEDNVWVGDRVIILGGVTIGEGAIIQAGSVVSCSIQKHGIAGGNPAKVFKFRNIEHYSKLKNENKFF